MDIIGTKRDDILGGTVDADTIRGKSGDDQIYGNPGDDTLYGGRGKDFLAGGLGADTLYGGRGKDTFYFDTGSLVVDNAVDHIADYKPGKDVIRFDSHFSVTPHYDPSTGVITADVAGVGTKVVAIVDTKPAHVDFQFADGPFA